MNAPSHGATKAMLNSITELLALELGPGIRVNGVAPAVVKTRFAAALYEGREEETSRAYPLKRLGVPDDVGGVVAFLLSHDAAWMTGQTLVLDGGGTLARNELSLENQRLRQQASTAADKVVTPLRGRSRQP